MPIEYVPLAINGDHGDAKPTRVLIAKITELEKLHENNVGANRRSKFLWNQQKHTKKKF
jgi:hypothetical protein